MRRPFPQKKGVTLSCCVASLTYLRFGSAGGNPDKRADTHLWTFSYEPPIRKTQLVTRPAQVLSGLVSVICPTWFAASKEFGRHAWDELSLADQRNEGGRQFQNFPQHMIVTDVDDAKQSVDWKGFPKREMESAIAALAKLVFIAQSSFALNNDTVVIDEDGFFQIL